MGGLGVDPDWGTAARGVAPPLAVAVAGLVI